MSGKYAGATPGNWILGMYDPTYVFGGDGDEIC